MRKRGQIDSTARSLSDCEREMIETDSPDRSLSVRGRGQRQTHLTREPISEREETETDSPDRSYL